MAIVLLPPLEPEPAHAQLPVVSAFEAKIEANAPVLSAFDVGGLEIGGDANKDSPLIGIDYPPS